MDQSETHLDRLNQWLRKANLSADAETCLTNFVLSCDNPDEGDISNFLEMDITDFEPGEQDKLMQGFVYAYFGEETKITIADMPSLAYGLNPN